MMPQYCFVSAEAANWLLEALDGITSVSEATDILQRLVEDHVICHASGNGRHRFIYGFYLYFVNVECEKKGGTCDFNL
ncbi:GATOR complex protein DEPDC5 [Lamellibrachia satsuma]|nr:GATOR complex protein DEPDC5 [Lamellibrachia satsuma]